MIQRRSFCRNMIWGAPALSLPSLVASNIKPSIKTMENKSELQISLAQWSLHRAFTGGELDARDFASIASKTFGIQAIEYVNQFYTKDVAKKSFWEHMKSRADDVGVKSLLIMVDDEGRIG